VICYDGKETGGLGRKNREELTGDWFIHYGKSKNSTIANNGAREKMTKKENREKWGQEKEGKNPKTTGKKLLRGAIFHAGELAVAPIEEG